MPHLSGRGPVIVLVRRHLNVHIVAAGGGGDSLAAVGVGAVQQGGLRVGTVVLFALVGHRVLRSIVGKVCGYGRVADGVLPTNGYW